MAKVLFLISKSETSFPSFILVMNQDPNQDA